VVFKRPGEAEDESDEEDTAIGHSLGPASSETAIEVEVAEQPKVVEEAKIVIHDDE
jgi:hypothetical protein